jgi:hypothetical protein
MFNGHRKEMGAFFMLVHLCLGCEIESRHGRVGKRWPAFMTTMPLMLCDLTALILSGQRL